MRSYGSREKFGDGLLVWTSV